MRTVAVFGGSFNPPHTAHQLAALHAIRTQPIDELWLVPVLTHPCGKWLAPYADRVAMCELAVRELGPRAWVSRAEQELADHRGFATGHTFDLIEYLAALHRDARFRLVVGADVLGRGPSWHRWDDLIARAPLIVVGRERHDISATRIRSALARMTPEQRKALADRQATTGIASMVPSGVLRYIVEHDLFSA